MTDGIIREPKAPLALWHGREISRGQFFRHVMDLSRTLPDSPCFVNLCEDRYLFCVALIAAVVRGRITLLPPNHAAATLEEIVTGYGRPCALVDSQESACPEDKFVVTLPETGRGQSTLPAFDPAQTAVVAFTSGSTGHPKGHPKTWRTFASSARMALRHLALEKKALCVVSTTPPQHMFGLETSIFWPLFSRLVLHSGRPFFPEDIRRTVESAPLPCLLASTPTHLRACSAASGEWHNVERILSSTAPLPRFVAETVEKRLGAPLQEIFGSTETLSFASRRPGETPLWQPYEGACVKLEGSGFRLHAPHLDRAAPLQDLFELREGGRFALKGRMGDIVKVAGKRCSLSELDHHLNRIVGVEDGCFFTLAGDGLADRVGALVVSRLPRETILQTLKQYVDEVFMPRPLHRVRVIPRNAVGKLVRSDLDRLLEELKLERTV